MNTTDTAREAFSSYRNVWIKNFGREMTAVSRATGCWLWLGQKNQKGYGLIASYYDKNNRHKENRFMVMAHRYFFETNVRPLVDGEIIDHLCRNRLCVNPQHLDAVDIQENVRRGLSSPRLYCGKGHLKQGSNLRISNKSENSTDCKICAAARQKAYKERKRRAILAKFPFLKGA